MSVNAEWIPMKWPSGPLEISRLAAKQALTPELKRALLAWIDPQALELVKGTPVNCLIVPWAAGEPEDKEHQQSLEPQIRAGAKLGISFIGTVTGSAEAGAAVSAGLRAGLAGVLLEKAQGLRNDVPAIIEVPRSKVPWDSAAPLLSITENLWPGLGLDTMKAGDTANAGPTGVPWVNSNGWFSLLARAFGRGKTVWLEFDPPESSDLSHPANYTLAIADSEAYGSRWEISLDDRLRAGLSQKDPRATKVWEKIKTTLSFFKDHEEWSSYHPQGFLAVISDFRGNDEFLATEALNLLARRHVQYKTIERSDSVSAPLNSLKAVLWIDGVTPSAAVRSKLLTFVQKGGLLVSATYWGPPESKLIEGDFSDRYELRTVGKGRIAVPKNGFKDPYEVAVDTHLLLSRRNDWVRIFNAPAANAYCSTDPQKRKQLVQILNYSSSGSADFVSVWLKTTNRTATLWNLGAKEPTFMRGVPARGGVEFQLPSLSAYTALEFETRGTQ